MYVLFLENFYPIASNLPPCMRVVLANYSALVSLMLAAFYTALFTIVLFTLFLCCDTPTLPDFLSYFAVSLGYGSYLELAFIMFLFI